jgi:hypothetical protein
MTHGCTGRDCQASGRGLTGMRLEGVKSATNRLSQRSRCTGRDSIREIQDYEFQADQPDRSPVPLDER